MKLLEWRTNVAKLSRRELGRKLGRTRQCILRWENGERFPSHYDIVKIFMITGGLVTANDFYGLTTSEADDEDLRIALAAMKEAEEQGTVTAPMEETSNA